MQPQGHLQVAVQLIDDQYDPQQALDSPRFCIGDGSANGQVSLEEGIPVNVILFPMEGDPMAASMYWRVAVRSRGSFFSPSEDWP